MQRIALLSDTHNYLDPKLFKYFETCDQIWHAGDIGTIAITDELSKIKDETLHHRKAEVPRVKAIIQKHIAEFTEWVTLRKNVPLLKAVKTKLYAMQTCNLFINYTANSKAPSFVKANTSQKIQKVINLTATKMRARNQGGCNFIEAINEYLEVSTN